MTIAGSHSGTDLSTRDRAHGIASGYERSVVPLLLVMVGSYVLLKPYYLFPSGLPQIGDMVIATALPFALLLPQPRQSEGVRGFQFYMILFCTYAALVNLGWTFALMDPRIALFATYYLFNLCLMVVCLRLGMLYPRETLLAIAYAVSISAVIQAASVVLGYDPSRDRQVASFNNPNQLGYWAVLSLCLFWCIAGKLKIKWYIQVPTVMCLIYGAASSLSKSAIISIVLLSLLQFVKRPMLLFIILLAITPAYLVLENTSLFERVSERMNRVGEDKDDKFTSRGYLRILQYPEYVAFGAGEGALYRFPEEAGQRLDKATEIHSTLGTILFSYGLIGSLAFGAAIWRLYRISTPGRFLYLLTPFLYGLTHQGLRFSFLWLLFAVIAIVGLPSLQEKLDARDHPEPAKDAITGGKPGKRAVHG